MEIDAVQWKGKDGGKQKGKGKDCQKGTGFGKFFNAKGKGIARPHPKFAFYLSFGRPTRPK